MGSEMCIRDRDDGSSADVAPSQETSPEVVSESVHEQTTSSASSSAKTAKYGSSSSSKKLSPAVRRLAAENKLDLAKVTASGKEGRVTKKDVLAYLAGSGAVSVLSPPVLTNDLLPFDRIRKLTAEHMVMSKATSPHVLQAVEVNYGAVDEARKRVGPVWKADKGYSLTYLPFIAKALVYAMGEFPRVNASIEGDALQLHSKINLAIAVDLNFEGLVAPVVKDLSLIHI